MLKHYIPRLRTRAVADGSSSGEADRIVTVVLIELLRVDGKPCQRPAGYMGEMRVREMDDPVRLANFYGRVAALFDEMGIDVDERKKIERQIRAFIPRSSTYDS